MVEKKSVTMDMVEERIESAFSRAAGKLLTEREAQVAEAVDALFKEHGHESTVNNVIIRDAGGLTPNKVDEPYALGKRMSDLGLRCNGETPIWGTNLDKWDEESEEYRKKIGRPGQIDRTGLSVGTAASAGNLVKTEEVLDPIRLVAADDRLLARCNVWPMETDSMTLNLLSTDVTVSWTTEVTDTSSMSTQATGLKPETLFVITQATLTRYIAHVYVLVSRKLLRTAPGMVEKILNERAPAKIRGAFAKAIMSGTNTAATDPINGLDNRISTNAVTYNPADKLMNLLELVKSPGIALPGVARSDLVVTSPRGVTWLMDLAYNDGKKIFMEPRTDDTVGRVHGIDVLEDINGLDTYGSGSTDSRIYSGAFGEHCNIGLEPSIFTQVNPYIHDRNNLVAYLFEFAAGFVPSSEAAFSYVDVPRLF